MYLLDQTHTALTLNAECRDGLLQALEPSSLPADYTGEQLLQFALCQNRVVSLVDCRRGCTRPASCRQGSSPGCPCSAFRW